MVVTPLPCCHTTRLKKGQGGWGENKDGRGLGILYKTPICKLHGEEIAQVQSPPTVNYDCLISLLC